VFVGVFVRAKRSPALHYIYSRKRSFLSLVVVTTLLSTSVINNSIAVDDLSAPLQVPGLCDPSVIAQPVFVSPTPSQTPTPTESVVASPSPSLSDKEVNALVSQELAAEVIPKVVCPSAVTNLVATPQNNQVLVSWTPGLNAEVNVVENISNFYLKILETNEIIKVTGDKTSTLVSGLKNGVKYSFVVYAASEYGASAPSELISAIPLSGNESEVAGLIIEFKDTTVIKTGDKEVPGEELVDQVDLTISNEITEDVRLVEFSEPTTLSVAQNIATEIAKDKDVVWAEPDRFVYTSAADLVYPIFRGEQNKKVLNLNPTGNKIVKNNNLDITKIVEEKVVAAQNNNNSETTKIVDEKVVAAEIVKDKAVVQAAPDQFANTSAFDVVNDPSFPTDQWNLWDKFGIGLGQSKTQMSTAWSSTAGQGITVAVIDTGITSHPDLDSQLVNGFDFVSNPDSLTAPREENGEQVSFDGDYIDSEKYGALGWDTNPTDPGDWRGISPIRNSTWHGTHIAGIIAAQNNNNQGIAGIAPGSKIQPISFTTAVTLGRGIA
jgi:subtilisin family serine protease